MNQLRLIENGIVPVYEGERGQAVNARELHHFLEVGRDFTNWIKDRLEKFGFIENEDYIVFTENGENLTGGRPKTEYILTLDTAKEIAMVQNNEKGSQARKYFIAIEKKYKQLLKPKCIEDVLIESLQEMKNMRQQVEIVKQQAATIHGEVQDIRDTVIVVPNDWRRYCVDTLRKIAYKNDMLYDTVNKLSYQALKSKGYDIERRLNNRRERAQELGVSKSKIDKFNYLDCIGEDKKLIDAYINIVKQMAIKYKVA